MTVKRAKRDPKLVAKVAETGLFDERWYQKTYPKTKAWGLSRLDYFVRHGARAGHRPNAYFDPAFYGAQAGIDDPIDALLHYASTGWRAGLDPSPMFQLEPYLSCNADLADAGVEPLSHFLKYGRNEGRRAVGCGLTIGEISDGDTVPGALYQALRKSPLFDAAYYLAEYAYALNDAGRHASIKHYLLAGERMGCHPNPFFDPEYYAAQLPAAAAKTDCLLLHYQNGGWRKGYNPSARFDTRLYAEVYDTKGMDPLSHYLSKGIKAGNSAFPVELLSKEGAAECKALMVAVARTGLFDAAWYLKINEDLNYYSISPLEHYVRFGAQEGRAANPYFDTRWYQKHYKDLIGDELALLYYAREGYKLQQDTSPLFSGELYFQLNPDLTPGEDDALAHYWKIGRQEERTLPNRAAFLAETLQYLSLPEEEKEELKMEVAATGLFSSAWYVQEYADQIKGGLDPLDHYLINGLTEGLNPNPYFDTNWYFTQHRTEIGEKHPLIYYAEEGAAKGDWPSPEFDPDAYVAAYPDVKKFPGSPLMHYLRFGISEGRELPEPEGDPWTITGSTYVTAAGNTLLEPVMEKMISFERVPLAPEAHEVNSAALNIHWVIPDFSAGGGGHMTIFRMVSFLERQGHKLTVWIHNPCLHRSPEDARETILKYFQYVRAEVKFIDPSFVTKAKGDAIIATDCWSVWPVMAASNFVSRFYFVQDFEPYFHPMGGKYLAAELTYKQDLFCICASPWLSERLKRDYGRETSHFWLAADQRLYKPLKEKPKNRIPRIAFYSRISTDRRAVELGLLGLERLARRGVRFHVDFFGGETEIKKAPFPFTDHGIAAPAALAGIFSKADIGVVFSATNYSLVPQEMMACGLPIVELDGESTRAIYPQDTVTWAAADPFAIADAIEALIGDEEGRLRQADVALEWVSGFSWHKAAAAVEAAVQGKVAEAIASGRASGCTHVTRPLEKEASGAPHASVVIPTYNAGAGLDAVLDAVCNQHTPWAYEVLVIDSGSTDETLDIVAKHEKVKLHHLEKGTFNHGATRNLGVELTQGDYIAFLTHDALPANDAWLFNLVSPLEEHPDAAGAFGRHLAYPDASAFTTRDLDAHFKQLLSQPLTLSARTDARRYKAKDEGWRQILHFYSDNNSCMRRSVWEKIPYRRVAFGEDQLWADDIIAAGYEKLYAAQAVVYHSHDFDEEETRERSSIESSFFKHFFDYGLIKSEDELEDTLAALNDGDERWGLAHGLDEDEIELRKKLNAARLRGYLEGYKANTKDMF
ncbi:glycosyltransferase [Kordiimonas marina]|uniref:glycosyltransferase n=1 Tax=Kordiimonas marina TaxID=2872312 RepID=UPI001FF5435A|nr:glycosyltransferase [Kordiimonas marina]MCJ9430767.1 glycosyltransferase [Kordiimonas marina]